MLMFAVTMTITYRPFCHVPLLMWTVLLLASVTAAEVSFNWTIDYLDMTTNFTVNSAEELIFRYSIPSNRTYEYKLFEEDCSTEVRDDLIISNRVLEEPDLHRTNLTFFYDMNMTALGSSDVVLTCLVIDLFETATGDNVPMIIAQNKHVMKVTFNFYANFDMGGKQYEEQGGWPIGQDSYSANLAGYVEACKCTDQETFTCDSSPLAINEVFHVCVKSSSTDVQIMDVTQMNIDQGNQTLTVIEEGEIKYKLLLQELIP